MEQEILSPTQILEQNPQALYNAIPHFATVADLRATSLRGGWIYLESITTGNGFYFGTADVNNGDDGTTYIQSSFTYDGIPHLVSWQHNLYLTNDSLIITNSNTSGTATINTADITTANVTTQNESSGTATIGTADITTANISGTETTTTADDTTANITTANITTATISGDETIAGTESVTGTTTEGTADITEINPESTSGTALAGTTAGTVTPYQVESGVMKKVAFVVAGYENDTTTSQTITYTVPFTNIPTIANSSGLALTTTATVLTITAPDATTLYSGMIIIEGI